MWFKLMRAENVPTMQEWVEQNALTVLVVERDEHLRRFAGTAFYAYIERVEVKEDVFLRSATGNGQSPDQALWNLAKEIGGKFVVVNAYDKEQRRVLFAPRFVRLS